MSELRWPQLLRADAVQERDRRGEVAGAVQLHGIPREGPDQEMAQTGRPEAPVVSGIQFDVVVRGEGGDGQQERPAGTQCRRAGAQCRRWVCHVLQGLDDDQAVK